MTYHEAIELIIKLNCEFGAIERLLKSIHEKKNKAEDELSERQACMKAASKINKAKYNDDAIDALLSEVGET